jgi:hypothetical protein
MGRPYMVTGRVLISLSAIGGLLIKVELLFNAADATKPPAPRVEDGIIHGIDGLVGEEVSLGGVDSVRSTGSSLICDVSEGVERDDVNRETALYGDFPSGACWVA